MFLALAFTVELFPPFGHEVQLGLEVGDDFNLLAGLSVESLPYGCILCGDVLTISNVVCGSFLHVGSTFYQFSDVESSACYRQQAHRSEHREASTHVVRNDKRLVSFLVSSSPCGSLMSVGNGYNNILSLFFATLCLALLLEKTEGECCFGCRTRLRYVDNSELLILQISGKFREIILANVVTGKGYDRVFLILDEPREAVRESFYHGTGSQIRASDTCYNHNVALTAQRVSCVLYLFEKLGRDA